MEPIFEFLARYMELTDDERKLVTSANRVRKCKKNERIKSALQESTESFFVLSGCVYSLYVSNDDERVGDFFFAGDPVLIPPAEGGAVSPYELRCMEATTLAVSREDEVERLVREFPRFERVCRLFAEERLAQSGRFHDRLKGLSPLEKYRLLLEERPLLMRHVPQRLLSSYLGIAPETLSRVRRQLRDQSRAPELQRR